MDDLDVKEIYRDHFGVCLLHFFREFQGISLEERKKSIGDFCGVGYGTVRNWSLGESKPRGEMEARVTCYLMAHGYKIIEFQNLPKVQKFLWEIIGFGIFSPSVICQRVGYNKPSYLFSVFRGEEDMTDSKGAIAVEVYQSCKIELQNRKRKLFSDIASQAGQFSKQGELTIVDQSTKQLTSALLMHLVEGMLCVFGDCSPERLVNQLSVEDEKSVIKLTSQLHSMVDLISKKVE